MTREEKIAEIKQVEQLAKDKKVQKQFPLMLDEYVYISRLMISLFGVENVPEIMKQTYVKTFKNYDMQVAQKKDNKIMTAGLHHNVFINKTNKEFHRIAINPYADNITEYIEQEFVLDGQNDNGNVQSLKRANSPDSEKKKKTKFLYAVDDGLIAKSFQSVMEDKPFPTVLAAGTQTNKSILTHEMFHSFVKRENVKATSDRSDKAEKVTQVYNGGTKNINLHEGMTEYLTAVLIANNKNYFHIPAGEEYRVAYAPYVAYVSNMNSAFRGSVQDVYLNGLKSRINKYKDKERNYSINEMMSDFDAIDQNSKNIINGLIKAEQQKVVVDERENKGCANVLSYIEEIYNKQIAYFNKLLNDGAITKEQYRCMEQNLVYCISESLRTETVRQAFVTEQDGKFKIVVRVGLTALMNKHKLNESTFEQMNVPLHKALKQKMPTKFLGTTQLDGYLRIRNTQNSRPKNLYIEPFFVLTAKAQKEMDMGQFNRIKFRGVDTSDCVVLKDGTIAFTKNFADLTINGFDCDGAIGMHVEDGVLKVVPNLFLNDKKAKGFYNAYWRENPQKQDLKTPQNLTAEQTMSLLKITKVFGVPLIDVNIAPNINLSEKAINSIKYDEQGVAQKEKLMFQVENKILKIAKTGTNLATKAAHQTINKITQTIKFEKK